jgi:hypothetical protein
MRRAFSATISILVHGKRSNTTENWTLNDIGEVARDPPLDFYWKQTLV